MALPRGDQPIPVDEPQDGQVTTANPEQARLDASRTLLAAADSQQPTTWSRNDGGRYFDQAQQPGDRLQANGWVDVPAAGGTIRIDPRGASYRILGPNGEPRGGGPLKNGEPTAVRMGNVEVYVNPDKSVDAPTQKGFERSYQGGVREQYEKGADNKYTLTERRLPNGSYEKYAGGRLTEVSDQGFVTKFDANGRKTEVNTPSGDKYAFKYGATGKVDSYEVSKKNAQGESQVVEKASRVNGNLQIERRQDDGTMKVVESMKDRTDVAIRSDLKLDYLDKDGYGLPDAAGRRIKRDDRTVLDEGTAGQYPINPIRSIRLADGRQIDYEYNSDKSRAQGRPQSGPDGLTNYTIRDKAGKILEFAQKIPEIPGTERKSNTGWFEYKAKPGQPLPEDQVARVKLLMAPADPARMTNQQQAADMQTEMLKSREELQRTRPMMEFMPTEKGRETTQVVIDQTTGKQYNGYANGEVVVRNERGHEYKESYDKNTGDKFETYGDGTTYRRAWDGDPRRHAFDRTTVTMKNADGVPRVELHHSRKDNSFIDVNYDPTGTVAKEVIVTPPGGQPIRMAPDAANPSSWLEYKRDGNEWKPTGRAFPMKVDLVGKESNLTVDGRKIPPGTIVISQGDKRRVITPAGEEILGKVGGTPTDTVSEKVLLTPPLPSHQPDTTRQPPDWTQQGPTPRERPRPGQPPQQRPPLPRPGVKR